MNSAPPTPVRPPSPGTDLTLAQLLDERALFLSGPVVVFQWAPRPGLPVVSVSANVERVFGHPAAAFLGGALHYGALIHPADRERAEEELARAQAAGHLALEHAPYRLRHADGRYLWVADSTRIVHESAEGPARRLGYVLDITDRIEARDTLGAEHALLHSLIDAIPDLLYFKDTDGRYVGCNPAFERYCGRPEEQLIGKTDRELFDRDAVLPLETTDAGHTPMPAPGTARCNEQWLTYPDGRRALLETLETPYRDAAGNVAGLIGISRDFTVRHEAERARLQLEAQLRQAQKMEAIGQLTGGIAHDFNNLLGVILGTADLGLEEADEAGSPQLRAHFEEIRRAGRRARNLVAKMLAFSRQRPTSARVPVDPVTGVPDVLRMLRPTLPASLTIEVSIDPATPPFMGDLVELHQVLTNLVINARDAVQEHGCIGVRVAPVVDPAGICATCGVPLHGAQVLFEVADDGAGIAPEHLPRIFDPFFTTKEVGHGTGMGLSVVHGIVHGAGGHLQVESTLDAGTRMRVYLPAAPGPGTHPERNSGALPALDAERPLRKVILVDDEPALLGLITRMLRRAGYEVAPFGDPREALEAFRAAPQHWDAIVTDQTMPELTGRELLAAALSLRPDLPTLLMTGYSAQIGPESARAMGVRGFLHKPATHREIVGAVNALFLPV